MVDRKKGATQFIFMRELTLLCRKEEVQTVKIYVFSRKVFFGTRFFPACVYRANCLVYFNLYVERMFVFTAIDTLLRQPSNKNVNFIYNMLNCTGTCICQLYVS